MALTRDQLLAINAGFASDPGVEVPQTMQEAQQSPLLHLLRAASGNSPPVNGGDAPMLPGVSAAQPVPGAPPVDPATVAPYPGIHPDLHNRLVNHFAAQARDAQQVGDAARGFLGPTGVYGQAQTDALQRIRDASDDTEVAEKEKAKGEADLAGRQANSLEVAQRQDEQRMAAREKMVQDYQRKATVLADQAQQAEVRDFWADKSTGSRILGILAQTLSGAANGLAGNPSAPSALDRIIDRDLEIQQKNLQNKRLAADHAQNALGQVYRGFESEDASIAAYRQAAAKWYAAKSQQLTSQFAGDTASARNQMVQAKAEQDTADSQAKLAQHAADAADRSHQAADDNSVQLARDESNERLEAMAREGEMVDVPGVNVRGRKQLFDAAWRKQSEAFAGTFAQLDNIEKQVDKPGFSIKSLAQSEAGKSLLEGDVRQLLGTGANLSKYEEKSLKALSADYLRAKGVNSLSELGAPDYKDYIRAMRTAVARTFQARVRARFAGGDVARHPGFESAYDALQADDAE